MSIKSLTALDVMSRNVVTVPPSMPVPSLAHLLADRGISSAPVISPEGELLGIVTEADLLRRLAATEDAPVTWLGRLFGDANQQADSYARTYGMLAQDVMTKDVLTVAPHATAEHCAQLMEQHRIKRLPVLSNGRLVGVVSRSDLLRAILERPAKGSADPTSDATIRIKIRDEMREQTWAASLYVSVLVRDGVVTLNGFVRSDAIRRGLNVLVSRVEGVTKVDDQMVDAPVFLPGEMV